MNLGAVSMSSRIIATPRNKLSRRIVGPGTEDQSIWRRVSKSSPAATRRHRQSTSISEHVLASISISRNKVVPLLPSSNLCAPSQRLPLDVRLVEYFDQLERHRLGIDDKTILDELIPTHLQVTVVENIICRPPITE
jgi:hypothetical protein